jgi:hypothetical protein
MRFEEKILNFIQNQNTWLTVDFQRAEILCIMTMKCSTPKMLLGLIVYGLDLTTFYQLGVNKT